MYDRIHKKILGISGSLRSKSHNTGMLNFVQENLPDGVSMEIADLADIPLFNQDDEADLPASVQRFKAAIAVADAILIATPEYNHSIPGVLKNAIDWASRKPNVLSDKPLGIVGAGGQFGTTRAQYHLRQIATSLNMHALNVPQVLVYRAWEKFDADGRLFDEETQKILREHVRALIVWTRRLRQPLPENVIPA